MKIAKTRINGFTIIEMLAVMFIIGIIFSITMPAFGPIMRNMKLTTSAENLANVLESARQYAKTSSKNCYVVFPISIPQNDPNAHMNYKAYKIYSWDGSYGANGKPSGETIGKWEMLPNGLQIDQNSTFLTHPWNQGTISGFPFPEDNDSGTPVRYILFKPSKKSTISASIKLVDSQSLQFGCVTFYNSPTKVKVWDLGYLPGSPEEWEE